MRYVYIRPFSLSILSRFIRCQIFITVDAWIIVVRVKKKKEVPRLACVVVER